MRGRAFVVEWQGGDTPEVLKVAYQAERDPALRTRLQGLWLLRCGRTLGEVADVVGMHYRSVQRWAAWYRAGGLAAVRSHRMGGRGQVPFLTAEHQAIVAAEVATGRFRTGQEIRTWLTDRFEVTYTLGGLYSLLERLHCAPKVPRPVHAKADAAVQEAWQKGDSRQPCRTLA